jgi:hypothetical protein
VVRAGLEVDDGDTAATSRVVPFKDRRRFRRTEPSFPRRMQARANIRHGEGAHVEHLLAYWDSHGIRYVVSVHRTVAGDRPLLERLVSSIELIGP